MTTHPQGLFAF